MIQTKKQNDTVINAVQIGRSSCNKFPKASVVDTNNIIKSDKPKTKPKNKA